MSRLVQSALLAILVLSLFGCGPSPEIRAFESKARDLVARSANTNDAVAAFQRPPSHIYTQADASRQLQKTDPGDKTVHHFWSRLVKHSQAHAFPIPGGEILIFFDDGRATDFYSNIQL
jgi:hypothetical protein